MQQDQQTAPCSAQPTTTVPMNTSHRVNFHIHRLHKECSQLIHTFQIRQEQRKERCKSGIATAVQPPSASNKNQDLPFLLTAGGGASCIPSTRRNRSVNSTPLRLREQQKVTVNKSPFAERGKSPLQRRCLLQDKHLNQNQVQQL